MKRQRTGKHPQLEEAIVLWISRAVAVSQTITGEIIQEKAEKNVWPVELQVYSKKSLSL